MDAIELIVQFDKEYATDNELLNAVKELIKIKCKEQREIVMSYIIAEGRYTHYNLDELRNIISNAPEPE